MIIINLTLSDHGEDTQMPTGWTLHADMRAHATANADGGWQCEVTTTATHTPFAVKFVRA